MKDIRKIDIKRNKLLFPLHLLMGKVVHLLFTIIKPIVPKKYKGKILQLEQSNTFNNVFGLTLFNAIGGIVVMLTNVKIANVLGASLYGLYSYYLAVGEVGQNFVRYGRNKTMTRDLIQNPSKFESLISNTLVLGLLNLCIYLFVVLLFSKPLDITLSIPAILLLISPCLGSIDFQPVYESLKQMSWHSMYLLIQKCIFLILLWGFLLLYDTPSLGYLGSVLFFSWFFIIVIEYWEIIIGFGIRIRLFVSLSSIKGLYKENFLIALSCMTGVAFGPLIRLILKNYTDTQSVGIYSAGMQIFVISQFILHQISRVGNPMMAEAGKDTCTIKERKTLCKKYVFLTILSTLPFFIPLFFFPQLTTNLFFTEEYSDLSHYLPFFGIYLAALAIGVVYTQFLISMRKDKIYFIIYVSSAISTILVAFLLIPIWGVLGAVIALCIPHSIGCLFYFICSIKFLK